MEKALLSRTAVRVLEARYLARDPSGDLIEGPEEMFRRVAKNVASSEAAFKGDPAFYEDAFYSMLSGLLFLPNSPTLMNAGRRLQQLAACFVLPIEDSLDSIFASVRETAIIHQSGGGTGFSFSRLRPENDRVGSTGGVASGPVSFMRVFDAATESIRQGGTRRGANMGVLRVDHPDIEAFITAKDDPRELTNFNLSVALTDAFMETLEKGLDYDLINPRTGQVWGRKNAVEVFSLIACSAWRSAEPGVLFIDRIERANPTPHIGRFEATNPCGEQPLLSYEPCNLGSINIGLMTKTGEGKSKIDFHKLEQIVRLGVRFLDDVIEASRYPLPEITQMAKGNRKIGLGVMGFADLLVRLDMRYGSDESIALADSLMRFISEAAHDESRNLALTRGPFLNAKGSVFDTACAPFPRNATVTTLAPTGTLSIIASCSSGIEPYYALSYRRRILDGEEFGEIVPLLLEVAQEQGLDPDEILRGARKGAGDSRAEKIRSLFATAFEISPEAHVRMQGAFQRHTDNAVSKTINLPEGATVDDVREAYLLAWRLGCKGATVYRDKTREKQVLSCNETLYC